MGPVCVQELAWLFPSVPCLVGHVKEQDVFLDPEAFSLRQEQELLDAETPPSGRWGWGGAFTSRSLPRQHLWTVRLCPELGTLSVALESPSPFSGYSLLQRCPSPSDTQAAEPLPN